MKFSAVDIVAKIEWECLKAFTSSASVFKECLTNTVFELSLQNFTVGDLSQVVCK